MSSKIRILVADASASLRRMIVAVAESQDDMQICGSAENGPDAVDQFRSTQPDVVILNVCLPVLDGPGTVKAIRALHANVPILVFSTANVRGGEGTLKALSAGANDFVARPMQVSAPGIMGFLEKQLLPAVRNWHARTSFRGINPDALKRIREIATQAKASGSVRVSPASPVPDAAPIVVQPRLLRAPEIIVVGSSTGGPNALRDVLCVLPASLPVPILIVQHMPPKFTGYLADRLDQQCGFRVREAEDGVEVVSDTVLIGQAGRHMQLCRHMGKMIVRLSDGPPENHCRPSVDVLFRSAVEFYGSKTLGIVLTGMGSDGTNGCHEIKKAGGSVVVQDRKSCVVWGMPRSVEEAGLADAIVPLEKMGAFIHQLLPRRGSGNASAAAAPLAVTQ